MSMPTQPSDRCDHDAIARRLPLSRLHRIALFALLAGTILPGVPAEVHAATPAHCQAPEHRQFDFWIGDWDTFDIDGLNKPSVARNHIDAILGGCALREIYEQTDGMTGQSFTIYDADRHLWHQSWVTNRGQLLVLEGTLQGKRIVLDGIDHAHKDAMIRVSWEPQGNGVRETATRSEDGGHRWQPLFDILFRPHRS
jgi:hypothetical protein